MSTVLSITMISEKVDQAIKEVWQEDFPRDYDDRFLLREDTMKNAFYFHLRRRLGESFLQENYVRIYTEYFINGKRVDLAVVILDPFKDNTYYLNESVLHIVASVEMKYKGSSNNEKPFYEDIDKVVSYIQSWDQDVKHYLAFVQEKYFNPNDIVSWLTDSQKKASQGQLVELYAYWDEITDQTNWTVNDH